MKNYLLLFSFFLLTSSKCDDPVNPDPNVFGTPKLIWSGKISEVEASSIAPIISGDNVLFSKRTLNSTSEPVTALKAVDGTKAWEWDDYKVSGGLSISQNFYSNNGNTIITQGSRVYAIDKQGKTLWYNKVGNVAEEQVVGLDETIFQAKYNTIGNDNQPFIAKSNIMTGQWQTIFTDTIVKDFVRSLEFSKPFIDSNGDTTLVYTESLYRFANSSINQKEKIIGYISRFNVSKNKLVYRNEVLRPDGTTTSLTSAVVYQNKIIASNGKIIYCFNALSGQIIWQKLIGDINNGNDGYGGLIVENNKIFAANGRGFVYCFDASTGTELWKTPLVNGTNTFGELHYLNGVVYFSSGYLYALDEVDGKIIWRFTAPKTLFTERIQIDKDKKRVYISDYTNTAYCYETIK
jgi:outer membrane protein assembly factor BamB